MKIHYEQLEYQKDAIQSVVDLFDIGANVFAGDDTALQMDDGTVVGNTLEMDDAVVAKNLEVIQKRYGVRDAVNDVSNRNFSIEMETGTGKTYVYIRTMLELAKKYGLKKFIILVPSIAIREGVAQSLKSMQEHFERELGLPKYYSFTYDSGKLSTLREFTASSDVTVMVTTIQSFNKDNNKMRQDNLDAFYGDVPIEKVAQMRPVIIMDEPQNMSTELAKASIGDLHPLFTLRYSATHKDIYNLLYSLGPVEAYKQELVKHIDVIGLREANAEEFVFAVNKFEIKKGVQPKVRVSIEKKLADGTYSTQEVLFKKFDDVYKKSGKNDSYQGLEIADIFANRGVVKLSDGREFEGQVRDDAKEMMFKAQIEATIRTHMEKQAKLSDVKVLSLFFIDKVDNYIHNESLIRTIFEEKFNELKSEFDYFKDTEVKNVHSGYFTKKTKTGTDVVDTTGKSKKDKDTFDLIMRDKARLLSFDEEVSFVFSHSALREGWDNPNIFQICTLQETRSETDKRQKIGRGLRLPVNVDGMRLRDERVNILTVIANESYEEYVRGLQSEYRSNGQVAPNAPKRRKKKVRLNKEIFEGEFKELWEKIKKKTKYRVSFDESAYVQNVVKTFDERIEDIESLVVMVEKVSIDFDEGMKLKTVYQDSYATAKVGGDIAIGNTVKRIVNEVGVTREMVLGIFDGVRGIGKFVLIFENPEEFVRSLIVIMKQVLQEVAIDGLQYIETGEYYEMSIFDGYEVNSVQYSTESDKALHNPVVCDSEGEVSFAKSLDKKDGLKMFTKLPARFKIDTPLGTYNPDWGIVIGDDEKICMVRETKFGAERMQRADVLSGLREDEKMKILCGKKHFDAVDVDFKEATQRDLSDLA